MGIVPTVQPEKVAGDYEAEARATAALQLPATHLRENHAVVEDVHLVSPTPESSTSSTTDARGIAAAAATASAVAVPSLVAAGPGWPVLLSACAWTSSPRHARILIVPPASVNYN